MYLRQFTQPWKLYNTWWCLVLLGHQMIFCWVVQFFTPLFAPVNLAFRNQYAIVMVRSTVTAGKCFSPSKMYSVFTDILQNHMLYWEVVMLVTVFYLQVIIRIHWNIFGSHVAAWKEVLLVWPSLSWILFNLATFSIIRKGWAVWPVYCRVAINCCTNVRPHLDVLVDNG